MPPEFEISDEEISHTEKILLPAGKQFDAERKLFIRNFDTIDLQAVPGSGKTTALLAKLMILERRLPFNDGSGLLVISHTNAAIDEIRNKIQAYCPKLFAYPNFIGTIQSFVDEFLAIPYYSICFRKKPFRIDNEIFDEVVTNRFNNLPNSAAKSWLMRQNDPENFFRNLRFDSHFNLLKGINGVICLRSNSDSVTYRTFKKIKYQILKSGVLNYDDAYFLAELYLKQVPQIKSILQKRFAYCFVDEMQDMDRHQYDLLEKVFYDEGSSISKMQRIGDKNQAIYSSVKADSLWVDRASVLRLNGSQRLSKANAEVIKKFALHNSPDFDIVGLNDCILKPHILVFNNNGINNIIPRFAQLVKDYKQSGRLVGLSKDVKVICWNTDWKDDSASRQDVTKLRLEDYHHGFKKDKGRAKQDYDSLRSYLLFYDKNKRTLEPLRKNILNAFLKILRLENINDGGGRHYTKKKLIEFIRSTSFQKYEELNLNIYDWSIGIIKGKANDVFIAIKDYIPSLFKVFSENTLASSLTFINGEPISTHTDAASEQEPSNYYSEENLEIEITSVHAVKGQTHCATLYLESFYHGNYESERLSSQFLGNSFNDNRTHHKSSVKMAYVGFSRATSLLCIAIHKERFDTLLSGINQDSWVIVEV